MASGGGGCQGASEAYLAAVDAADDEPRRREQLRRHAEQVRAHVLKLSAKSY